MSERGIPQYNIDKDFPLMVKMSRDQDFAERRGASVTPLHKEIDMALRELWDARRFMAEGAGHDE